MFLRSIQSLVHYNVWANDQLALRLETMNEEQFHAEIASSFPSIISTIAHVHGAEDIWRQRLHKIQPTVFYKLSDNASGTVELTKWLDASRLLTKLVLSYSEEQLNESINYFDSRGQAHANFRWQIIQHCVNHSSYHRGQLITMMRQVGVTLIPNTDMIVFYRSNNQSV